MRIFLTILGIVGGFLMIKYRKVVGDNLGEADWMRKIGGVHNTMVILGIVAFFIGIGAATNTLDLMFRPLMYLIPGAIKPEAPEF